MQEACRNEGLKWKESATEGDICDSTSYNKKCKDRRTRCGACNKELGACYDSKDVAEFLIEDCYAIDYAFDKTEDGADKVGKMNAGATSAGGRGLGAGMNAASAVHDTGKAMEYLHMPDVG